MTGRRCSARCWRPARRPTSPNEEFHQWAMMPNFGIAYDTPSWGVFRATANRGYEFLDLGGGDGTSHAPYVLATDVFRANPRTSATLNQSAAGRLSARAEFRRHGRRHHPQRAHLRQRVLGKLGTPPAAQQLVQHDVRHAADVRQSERRRFERDPRSQHRRACSAVRSRSTTRFATPTRRTTRGPSSARIQFLYTRNFVGALGAERQLLVHPQPTASARAGIRRRTSCSSTGSARRT